MKRDSDPVYPESMANFDQVSNLIVYLEYAVTDVKKVSPLGAHFLKLVISCLGEEIEDTPAGPTLS